MKSRKEIYLELTPLLDVILIMMFYILMQNSLTAQKELEETKQEYEVMYDELADKEALAESRADELGDRLLAAEEREKELALSLDKANKQLSAAETFSEYASIVTISILEEDNGDRTLWIVNGDDEESYTYSWNSINPAASRLESDLKQLAGAASENRPVFVVFAYDDNIYVRDYEFVVEALENVLSDAEHVYVKYAKTNND